MSDPKETPRDRHLFAPGKKRILALDGGGVRGAVSIAFLERLEDVLRQIEGRPVRLCDWFDLIGGTSTGAIIAAGLAFGHSAKEMRDFYHALAPKVFKKPFLNIPLLRATFKSERLFAELSGVFGDETLGSEKLQTGFGAILKRMDTGSCWLLLNNPRSAFWETRPGAGFTGNRHYSLATIVRASTAAPTYFAPQEIDIVPGEAPGLFLDGGLTPHNNPALALFLAAALPPFGLNWRLGPEHLSILSIGTGSYRPTLSAKNARHAPAAQLAAISLAAQIQENQELTLTLMSWLGQGGAPWPLNSELGDLCPVTPPFGAQFRYRRCDIKLDKDWLAKNLGAELAQSEVGALRQMENPAIIPRLHEFGQKAAATQITPEMFRDW